MRKKLSNTKNRARLTLSPSRSHPSKLRLIGEEGLQDPNFFEIRDTRGRRPRSLGLKDSQNYLYSPYRPDYIKLVSPLISGVYRFKLKGPQTAEGLEYLTVLRFIPSKEGQKPENWQVVKEVKDCLECHQSETVMPDFKHYPQLIANFEQNLNVQLSTDDGRYTYYSYVFTIIDLRNKKQLISVRHFPKDLYVALRETQIFINFDSTWKNVQR